MSNKEEIATLKEIFLKAKNAARDNDSWLKDLELHSALRGALIDVGKEKIYELVDEVYPYLNDPFPEFRAEAVRTLGWNTRLGIDEFCEKQAYSIWEQDSDEEVKCAALSAWAHYYSDTKNKDVLLKLYDALLSEEYSSEIRAWSLEAILDVSGFLERPHEGYEILSLGDLKDRDEFNKAVDWERIHRIMQECVPGWKI